MKITKAILDALTAKTKDPERVGMNHDLICSVLDGSQRMLFAIESGLPLTIHSH